VGYRWTLLTSHGYVLCYLVSNPDATVRQVAEVIGLSERRTASILGDLEDADIVLVTRVGKRKRYEISLDATFRHPTLSHVKVRDVFGRLQISAPATTPFRWRG